MSEQMSVTELIKRVCDAGEEEVLRVYPNDDPRQVGALEGFRLARTCTTPDELIELNDGSQKSRHQDWIDAHENTITADEDTKRLYTILQIEWVFNVLAVGMVNSGIWNNISLSGRAVMQYARLFGVSQ